MSREGSILALAATALVQFLLHCVPHVRDALRQGHNFVAGEIR
jgi:hypothetical protein